MSEFSVRDSVKTTAGWSGLYGHEAQGEIVEIVEWKLFAPRRNIKVRLKEPIYGDILEMWFDPLDLELDE